MSREKRENLNITKIPRQNKDYYPIMRFLSNINDFFILIIFRRYRGVGISITKEKRWYFLSLNEND